MAWPALARALDYDFIMYCADGNFTEFIDDVADAGTDGFIFEKLRKR